MLRKIKKIDQKEFAGVDDINRVTIKGEMRKVYCEIHRKLTAGWTAKDVVELLAKLGLEMTVELFRVYLRDLDIERGYKRSIKQFSSNQTSHAEITSTTLESTKVLVPTPNSLVQITTYSNNLKKEQPRKLTEDLIRPEGITDAAWKDMKVQHLASFRKQINTK